MSEEQETVMAVKRRDIPGNRHVWQGMLLAAAAFMIVYGVSRGEAETVLNKAVNICLECVGLG